MVYNPFTLEGKTVFVTGASSGIGRAIAIECSRMGATMILTGRNEIALNSTLEALSGTGHSVVIADLNDSKAINSMVDQLPLLDGFICNAGVNKRSLCRYLKDEDIEWLINTNLTSPVKLVRQILKSKKLKKGSSVVFMSSIASYHSSIGDGIYSATKGGIYSFARVLALELSQVAIRVNAIQPGMVRTGLIENGPLSEEDYLKDEKKYPLSRYGRPEEIAHAAVYLLSDAAAWVTGTALVIDGGISLV